MTIAAFFRDSRVQSVLAGSRPAQATSIIRDFFSRYNYDDCAVPELLTLSDLASRCGDSEVAGTALRRVIAKGQNVHLAYYRLGRLAIAAKDFASAAEHFLAGTAADPLFAHNWMGAARALHALGRKPEAANCAERFVAFGVRPHAGSELAVLADLGDYMFDSGDRKRSRSLYETVIKLGAGRARDVVRLAEGNIAGGDYASAIGLLEGLHREGRLDKWGRRALAACYSHSGDHARAIETAEAVALGDPTDAGFVNTYLDVLARSKDLERMRLALEHHAALFDANAVGELGGRLKLAAGDVAGVVASLGPLEFVYRSRLYYLCFETAYAALAGGEHETALMLGERLAALAPDDNFVKLLRIDIYFRQQMWEPAGELLDSITADEADMPHLVLKRFEYACFVGDIPRAEALRARLEEMELPSKQFMLPVFRYLAERKSWNELVDRALVWLDTQLDYAQIGYVLFRAAKHTGRQKEMIKPDLIRLRANLAFDRAETLADLERLASDPTIAKDAVLARKIEVKRDVLTQSMALEGRRAIFLCTDRNYLAATIVALHSVVTLMDRREVDYFVVVDNELLERTRRFVAPFCDAGYTVTVVPAAEVVGLADKLYADYGLFTSGHVLASAAYYRIYFAKYLARRGLYGRAIYIDSDVLVRGSLEALFEADLGGRPMSARVEPMRPEVRRAIALHQLTDNRYFNSGVLLFDLKHERLVQSLDGAVAAILDDQTTLLFHDQCALNLGFRADFTDLDRVWNYTMGESMKVQDLPEDVRILHFLDRPKPWSAAYGGEAAILWFDAWRQTAAFVGETTAVELFGLVQE